MEENNYAYNSLSNHIEKIAFKWMVLHVILYPNKKTIPKWTIEH